MSIDSTADLLFRIGANTDDAQSNIQRFRTILGKDLGSIGAEFDSWSGKIFGELGTLKSALTAGAAVLAAGVVGVGAVLSDSTQKYIAYASEIGRGTKMTGLHADELTRLRYAAKMTGTDYDSLILGITRFQSYVFKANEGSEQQAATLHRLGLSTKEIQDGEQNILPLLMRVTDAFHASTSGTEKAAMARELFSRNGTALLGFLSKGSAGLQELGKRAEELGLVLGDKDVQAVRAYNLALKDMKAHHEALELQIGQKTMPLMEKWAAFKIALVQTLVKDSGGPIAEVKAWLGFFTEYNKALAGIEKVKATARASADEAGSGLLPKPEKIREEFYGISSILEQVKMKTASVAGEQTKATAEIDHLQFELQKATKEYQRLQAEGKLTGESAQREAQALAQLPAAIAKLSGDLSAEIEQKRNLELAQAHEELQAKLQSQQEQTAETQRAALATELAALRTHLEQKKLLTQENVDLLAAIEKAGLDKIAREQQEAADQERVALREKLQAQQEQSWDTQRAALDNEIAGLRTHLQKKSLLTQENVNLLAEIQAAGRTKIGREQSEAFRQELVELQSHLVQVVQEYMTSRERLAFQYDLDLQKYSTSEEQKALKTAQTEAEQEAIRQQFAMNRDALLQKYGRDLTTLANSQGWQAVFGSEFGRRLRGNEEALREWATAVDQAMLMVRLSMVVLNDLLKESFQNFAKGMAANIAQAIVYKGSIGEAMQAATAAALESLAAEAMVQAIFATALGFLRLAQWDFAGAASAFTAAAIFGTVGVASAIAGRAIAPSQNGSSSSPTASGTAGSSEASSSASTSQSTQQQGPRVNVTVYGHVYGISGVDELTSMINDAVLNRDVQLVSSQTKQKTTVVR